MSLFGKNCTVSGNIHNHVHTKGGPWKFEGWWALEVRVSKANVLRPPERWRTYTNKQTNKLETNKKAWGHEYFLEPKLTSLNSSHPSKATDEFFHLEHPCFTVGDLVGCSSFLMDNFSINWEDSMMPLYFMDCTIISSTMYVN